MKNLVSARKSYLACTYVKSVLRRSFEGIVMKISVIIPTLNEVKNINRLLPHLHNCRNTTLHEILIVDGGSQDGTLEKAGQLGVRVLRSPKKGRAVQMNYAATQATGDVLYFVHADVHPPLSCFCDIRDAVIKGFDLGCFTYRFDDDDFKLKINALFTRIDGRWNGGGDQTLFVKRSVFEELGGFKDHYIIMEDFDFVQRAREKYTFKIIRNEAIVSARKYNENGWLRVQLANIIVFSMFRLNYSQQTMAKTYRRLLKYRS